MTVKVFDTKTRAKTYAAKMNKRARTLVYVVHPYRSGWMVYARREGEPANIFISATR